MTKDEAIALYDSGWWKGLPAEKVAGFQLFEDFLCMDFGDFQCAVEKAIGRPVWTHEFGLNIDGLREEFLGLRPKATLEEIMDLIPEEKRIVIMIPFEGEDAT